MTYYLPLAGTGGARAGWLEAEGAFATFLREQGLVALRGFAWSTRLGGLFSRRRVWREEGAALAAFLQTVPYADRNLIAHSHGGQLALFAAAGGCRIRTLTTVGTPVRRDVPGAAAAGLIGYWQHVYDRDRDWIATARRALGALGDGQFGGSRAMPAPGVHNVSLAGIGHSDLFTRPACFRLWIEAGLIDAIKHGPGQERTMTAVESPS